MRTFCQIFGINIKNKLIIIESHFIYGVIYCILEKCEVICPQFSCLGNKIETFVVERTSVIRQKRGSHIKSNLDDATNETVPCVVLSSRLKKQEKAQVDCSTCSLSLLLLFPPSPFLYFQKQNNTPSQNTHQHKHTLFTVSLVQAAAQCCEYTATTIITQYSIYMYIMYIHTTHDPRV